LSIPDDEAIIDSGNTIPIRAMGLTDHRPVDCLTPIFWGADSCAGIGATGNAALFHEPLVTVDWVIEGMKSGEESLAPVLGCGVGTFLVHDRHSKEDIILKYGGLLLCDADTVTTSVGSSPQVGNFFNTSNGSKGARFHTADPADTYIQLPHGHSVALHVNDDGAYGCMITPVAKNDPRLKTATTIWMSEDCLYRPPSTSGRAPVRINHILYHLIPATVSGPDTSSEPTLDKVGFLPNSLVEEDTLGLAASAVADVLSDAAMGKYSYVQPLTGSADDLAILQSRFGGASGRAIHEPFSKDMGGLNC
jgi:hypothetical protein